MVNENMVVTMLVNYRTGLSKQQAIPSPFASPLPSLTSLFIAFALVCANENAKILSQCTQKSFRLYW